LIYRLGRKGYQVGGNDLSAKAVEYCNQRLERSQIAGRAEVQDMADFSVAEPFDAGFNTINSFRHLGSEVAAIGHLRCMAEAIRPGGIYVLGLHLTPTEGEPTDTESWQARRGHLAINTHMWPIEKLPEQRLERFGIRFDVYRPTGSLRIEDVLELRSYTASQFVNLVSAVDVWEVVDFFDFGYDLRRPVEIDAETEDVVAVMRRRP
jgi:SAM-dependent methyltransferase